MQTFNGFIPSPSTFNGFIPSPSTHDANCLPWVQDIIWIPRGGLLHALWHRHAKRHYLNRLLWHALQRGRGHGPGLQAALGL